MDIKEYEQKLQKAFCGQGGFYAKESYLESLHNTKTLNDVI